MCQALDELMADKMNEGILIGKHEGILIGKREGKHEGILMGKREGKHEGILLEKQNSEAKIRTIISNMLAGGVSCENICRFWNVILPLLNRNGKASSNIDILPVITDNAALLQNKEAFRNTYGNQEGLICARL